LAVAISYGIVYKKNIGGQANRKEGPQNGKCHARTDTLFAKQGHFYERRRRALSTYMSIRKWFKVILGITWQCKKCGYIGLEPYEYCPRCGAKYG